MRLTRVYVGAPLVSDTDFLLPDAAAAHVARVLRLRAGALIVAAGAEEERPRLKSLLTRWGLSMVVVGPVVAVIVLMLMGRS